MVGESVLEHVRRLRLDRAARRLKYGSASILEAALEAGYDSHEAFTRAFRSVFGRAPSEWRGEHAIVAEAAPRVEVRVVRIEAEPVFSMRHTGAYGSIGETWGALSREAGMRGLLGPWTRAVGISFDDPEITPADKLRYDAAFVVRQGANGALPPGDYISTEYRGSYSTLHLGYAAMCGTWLRHGGREIGAGPALEFYLNDPRHVAPEDLLTRICLPLD
jgi:AraC family transcriptional regulator